jgi:hypothetical protein
MKKTISLAAIAVLIAAFAFAAMHHATKVFDPATLGSTEFNRLESGVTNSSSSVGMTDTAVIAAGAITTYAKLTNDGAGIVYCAVGATSTVNSGIRLNPPGLTTSSEPTYHVFDYTNLPVQGVRCIGTTTTTLDIYLK